MNISLSAKRTASDVSFKCQWRSSTSIYFHINHYRHFQIIAPFLSSVVLQNNGQTNQAAPVLCGCTGPNSCVGFCVWVCVCTSSLLVCWWWEEPGPLRSPLLLPLSSLWRREGGRQGRTTSGRHANGPRFYFCLQHRYIKNPVCYLGSVVHTSKAPLRLFLRFQDKWNLRPNDISSPACVLKVKKTATSNLIM